MASVKVIHADGTTERFVSPRIFARARKGDDWAARWNTYIVSPEWRRRRAQHLKKHPRCRGCDKPAQVVHHRSYETLGYEKERHLISLCRPGHLFVHRSARAADGDKALFNATNSALGELRRRHKLTRPPMQQPTR